MNLKLFSVKIKVQKFPQMFRGVESTCSFKEDEGVITPVFYFKRVLVRSLEGRAT